MCYLLFDADETIWNFRKTEEISLKILFSSLGIPFSRETVESYEKGNLVCWDEFEKGRLTLEELEEKRMALFLERMGMDIKGASAAAALYATALSENGILLEGATEMLESLPEYRKALITNGLRRVQRGRIRATGIGKYFTHIFISQEMGTQKPAKRFFDIVLSTLNAKREECIVIGDSEKSDIKGAVDSGIRSILYSPGGRRETKADWCVTSYNELVSLVREITV